jgi:serine protease Do
MRTAYLLLLTLWLSLTSSVAIAADTQQGFAPLLKKVIPAVVNIRAQGTLPPTVYVDKKDKGSAAEQQQKAQSKAFVSLGSGVIIDAKKGYIITNAHVIEDAKDNITITLNDKRHFPAKVIGVDKPSDIAVIQIQASSLQDLAFHDSNRLAVGNSILAIGNPFGLGQSVTAGIVSALQRTNLQIEGYENFIQIDAPINSGNSGGALIDTRGGLVGINTAMLSPDGGNIGIGFAIPSNMVKNVVAQLIQYGKVERGVIGLMVQTLTPQLANALTGNSNTQGALITSIIPGSPADKAGIQVNDIIIKVNHSPVQTAPEVINSVGFLRTGTAVEFSLLRDNKNISRHCEIIAADALEDINKSQHPFLYGLTLQNYNQFIPMHGKINGVIVTGVKSDSNAATAGLLPGDVIIATENTKINTMDALLDRAAQSKNQLIVEVLRHGSESLFIVIDKDVKEKKETT